MATILDLFKEQNKDLYGLAGKTIIETKGAINPARVAALAVTSPNSVVDAIGNQVAGLIKGSAKRPSDTIFPNDKPFAKPISATSTTSGLTVGKTDGKTDIKSAIEPGKQYFVKTTPAPFSEFKIKDAISNPIGSAVNLAKDALRNPVGAKNTVNSLKNAFKDKRKDDTSGYGEQYQITNFGAKPLSETKKYSTFFTDYSDGSVKKRVFTAVKNFDFVNKSLLNILSNKDTLDSSQASDIRTFVRDNQYVNVPFVLFQKYGSKTGDNILLPGTITGLSDEATPEITDYRFIGSPFKQYRYNGVERTINFELKLYYVDKDSKESMKRNLDKLRKLVYPDEIINTIKYPNNKGYSPISFTGNLAYLTINGIYDGLLGFLETLSISIDDSVSWATTDSTSWDGTKEKPYPTVVNLTLGFKVINQIDIAEDGPNQPKLKFAFNEGSNTIESEFGGPIPVKSNVKTANMTTVDTSKIINR